MENFKRRSKDVKSKQNTTSNRINCDILSTEEFFEEINFSKLKLIDLIENVLNYVSRQDRLSERLQTLKTIDSFQRCGKVFYFDKYMLVNNIKISFA